MTTSLWFNCQKSAERIQCWFGKGKDQFFDLKFEGSDWHSFARMHKCDLVKLPRIPSQLEFLPLYGYVTAKSKGTKKRRHKTHFTHANESASEIEETKITQHCVNQRYPHLALGSLPLASERVAAWRLKEHLVGSKKLRELAKLTNVAPRRHDVIRLKLEKKKEENSPYLDQMLQATEERQFQIGRVIKYLVD